MWAAGQWNDSAWWRGQHEVKRHVVAREVAAGVHRPLAVEVQRKQRWAAMAQRLRERMNEQRDRVA